jgi:hypothetical protein
MASKNKIVSEAWLKKVVQEAQEEWLAQNGSARAIKERIFQLLDDRTEKMFLAILGFENRWLDGK